MTVFQRLTKNLGIFHRKNFFLILFEFELRNFIELFEIFEFLTTFRAFFRKVKLN